MRVLVYDRLKEIREDFVNVLLPEGFEVITIKNIKDIKRIFAKIPINIAILEVLDEDMEMTALLAKIKSEDKYADIKVIVHTQNPTKEFIAGMMQMGVDGFLLKPFRKHNLLERFKGVVSKMGVEIKYLHTMDTDVKPEDSIILSFRNSKRQIITPVHSISTKGLSFKLAKDVDAEFVIGESLSNIQFDIGNIRFIISAVIKDKKDRKCILVFEHITEKCLDTVYKYIYESYMEKIKNNEGFVK